MAFTVKHPFVSAIADDPAAAALGEVVPSNWNASHTIAGGTANSLLGFDTSGNGANVTISTGLSLSGNVLTATGAGSGTVTTLSVVSANGFAGTVANATTTPAVTLSTTITGLLKGNATSISAATVGTDYSVGTGSLTTGILKSTTGTGALSIAIAADFPTLNQNTSGNAATVTTNANLTGAVTSVGNATSLGSFSSANLATALTDETGSGAAVFATSPTFITPLLGTPTSGVLTNCTGTASGLTAGNVTTNANLTGPVTSVGNATTITANAVTTTTINAAAVTYAKIQNVAASSLLGNPTGSPAAPSEITLGSGLSFSGTTLVASGSAGGTVTTTGSPATGNLTKFSGATSVTNGDLSGDITTSSTLATTLATVNANTGSFGSSTSIPNFTVNGKGLITAAGGNSVIAPAGTLSGTTLNSTVVTSSLTSVGAQAQALNMSSHLINNVTDPSGAQDAATKNYVDIAVAALAAKDECMAATTAALAASTYNNGSSGVGATLTLTVSAVLVLDGYTPVLNDRLLIKNQASAFQNGIYALTTVGVLGVTQAVLTRTTDFNQPGDGINGALVYILNGTVNANTLWTCTTSGSITFGTTNINWSQFTGTTYTADETTLHLSGTTFSIKSGYLASLNYLNRSTLAISSNTTLAAAANTDYIYLVSGASTATLPTAVGNTNLYTVKRVGTSTVTVNTTSSQTMDGSTSLTMPVRYTSLTFISDNANWNIV